MVGAQRARAARAMALATLLSLLASAAARPRARIPDDLDNVHDDEEDEEFRAWGRTGARAAAGGEGDPRGDLPAFTQPGVSGQQLTFARLVPDPTGARTREDVDKLGSKWADLLRSGGMSEKIYAIDHDTVLISVKDGAYMPEVREFLWMQEEVAEFEWNSRVWKPGSEFPEPPKPPPERPAAAAKDDAKRNKKKKTKKKKKKRAAAADGGGDSAEL